MVKVSKPKAPAPKPALRRKRRADAFGWYPVFFAASCTRLRVSFETSGYPSRARDTVVIDARRSEAEQAAALAAPMDDVVDFGLDSGLVDTVESRGE